MESRIDAVVMLGKVHEDLRARKGFSEWKSGMTSRNHQPIVQILTDSSDKSSVDDDGTALPTLVYMAREKRPQHHHNFKAGAMNALIRVSSVISNSPAILNVDCDMYSNNVESIRDALCFFLDEEKGHDIGFVQFPQIFENNTKNDIYGNAFKVINAIECLKRYVFFIASNRCRARAKLCAMWMGYKVELAGLDSWGGPLYIGTGCFHRREHKRWSEGNFQIFLSKYCKIKLGLQMSYCIYGLWAPNSIPTLYYVMIPSLSLLKGISLFPKVSSPWIIPFAYVAIAKNAYGLVESLACGDTLIGWWNIQRMWLLKRITSYLYGTVDAILKVMGFSKTGFTITAKMADADASKRYEQEIMEFGSSSSSMADADASKRYEQEIMEFGSSSSSPMFVVIATTALVNLLCLVVGLQRLVADWDFGVQFLIQLLLCGVVVALNLPIYEALFLRKDKGRMAPAVTYISVGFTAVAYLLPIV
ncbi:hypothetical protein C4D60_Mb09t24300 [Musa balbisiana]|uniref:Glycosyltransferase 2-like domain-containing protein n=1 Tax=Musa balbisiana TaxID=52838 RepID=A0A4S8IIT7_MUSBA|nr:hypothetical protein C4D60_Mb09t24300 [Musa balbisiana]